ncbi:MAG: hypothetical protein HYX24_01750 [Candidatus Aenigmarchaeota archaeon]|nr:hypothetical protein [Candidatus Aenigmarchaeota archaeon]
MKEMAMDPEKAKAKVMMMAKVGMMLAAIGLMMVLSAIYLEFTTLKPALTEIGQVPKNVWELATSSDNPALVEARTIFFVFPPMLMTLKLGGIGFILSGIFIILMGILKALAMMPDRLKMALKG